MNEAVLSACTVRAEPKNPAQQTANDKSADRIRAFKLGIRTGLKLLDFVIGVKRQYILLKQRERFAFAGATAFDMAACRESAENPVPDDYTATKIGVAVIKVVGVV